MSESSQTKNNVAIKVGIGKQVSEKCTLTFETWFDQLTPIEVMHNLVDKLCTVADRQTEKYEIKDLEMYIEKGEDEVLVFSEQLRKARERAITPVQVEGRRLPVVKPNKQLETDIANWENNINSRKEGIARMRQGLKRRKEKFEREDK